MCYEAIQNNGKSNGALKISHQIFGGVKFIEYVMFSKKYVFVKNMFTNRINMVLP